MAATIKGKMITPIVGCFFCDSKDVRPVSVSKHVDIYTCVNCEASAHEAVFVCGPVTWCDRDGLNVVQGNVEVTDGETTKPAWMTWLVRDGKQCPI